MKKLLLLSGLLSLLSFQISATHLMGGQITVRQLSGLSYEITMTAYRDTTGIPINISANFHIVDLSSAYDTNFIAYHTGMNSFYNSVEVYQYIDTVLFPASSQYRISWEDCCRNGAILNMSNPLSESMYFMTEVMIDGAGTNSSPVFLNAPITIAQKFTVWQYNPLPFDADGDSLAWIMETPLSYNGDTVAGYTMPHADPLNPFSLNLQTGELTWMPDSNGNWEASFRVEEYRAGIKIGEIRRDMQIIVMDDTTNWHHPVFGNGGWPVNGNGNYAMTLAPNVPFSLTLNVTDQDNDHLTLDVNGEPMILANNPAQWTVNSNLPGNVTGTFSWTPLTSQARALPYIIAFRTMEFHNQSVFPIDQTLMLYASAATGIKNIEQDFSAGKLFPNPTSGNWFLSFELKHSSQVTIDVFDLVGQKISTVLDQMMPMGNNLVENSGLKLSSGYYFVQVNVNGQKATTYPVIVE